MTDIKRLPLRRMHRKYYAIAGKEFGEMAGRVVVIVRELYGRSAGASWNHHLAKGSWIC
jgi:hypothetical protein